MYSKSKIKRRIITAACLLLFGTFVIWLNRVPKVSLVERAGTFYEIGKVTEIISEEEETAGRENKAGYLQVRVKLLSGKWKGREIEAAAMEGYLYGTDCKPGKKVIVYVSTADGEEVTASVYSAYREPAILVFIAVFLLVICLIGGKNGVKAVAGLGFTFLCIFYMLLPMIYRGWSPILSAVFVSAAATFVTMYLIGGFSKKTAASLAGTIFGVLTAAFSACLFGKAAGISGMNVADVEELVFVESLVPIRIGELLFAGILISSLGAVMDVAMSVSSAIYEIHDKNPQLTGMELFHSGMNVGKDMMGTMSNTLVLAFTGGSLSTLILTYAYEKPFHQVMNMYQIGIEIMQGIAGSLGVVLTVPVSAAVMAWLLTEKKKSNSEVK